MASIFSHPNLSSPLSPPQLLALDAVNRLSALLSLLGALFTALGYVISPTFRSCVVSRLALAIALADATSSIAVGIGRLGPLAGNTSALCHVQSTLHQFGELASTLLIACLARNLLLVTYLEYSMDEIRKRDLVHIAGAFGLAWVVAVLPLFFPVHPDPLFSTTRLWCFTFKGGPVFIALSYTPAFAVALLACGTAVYVYIKVRQEQQQQEQLFKGMGVSDPQMAVLPTVVSLYLGAFVLAWFPLVLLFVLHVTGVTGFELKLTLVLLFPLRGLYDALVSYYQYLHVVRDGTFKSIPQSSLWWWNQNHRDPSAQPRKLSVQLEYTKPKTQSPVSLTPVFEGQSPETPMSPFYGVRVDPAAPPHPYTGSGLRRMASFADEHDFVQ